MKSEQKPTDVQGFVDASGATSVLEKLKSDLASKETKSGKTFLVSDVYDAAGNQYVDLAQEGGGVWGVALLGYTYIMEKMGIRFFSLAGTSAGAINTMLLAATAHKEEEKTEKIIHDFLQLDMFCFVDGKPANARLTKRIKKAIQEFVLKSGYVNRLTTSLAWIIGLFAFFSVASLVLAIFTWNSWVQFLSVVALVFWVVLIGAGWFLVRRFKTLASTGYGLNEGRYFHEWITHILQSRGIRSLSNLKEHFEKVPTSLAVKYDKLRDAMKKDGDVVPPGSPMLTIIASDITTGNKVEFPRMWDLYWSDTDQVNPGDFVRASMSIPLFFETFKLPVASTRSNLKQVWKNHLNWNGALPEFVQLVDGGVLSNFPINVFYNPEYIIPRMPTFGIRLGGTEVQVARNINSVLSYVRALIATIRSNTDKDFINRNKSFELGIQIVDMRKHSWLNFFMEEKEKQAMFLKGAVAAAEFLLNFDWDNYKKQRLQNEVILREQRSNPNNW